MKKPGKAARAVGIASLFGLAAASPVLAQTGLDGPPDSLVEWVWWGGSVIGPALLAYVVKKADKGLPAFLRALGRGESPREALDDVADAIDEGDDGRKPR